MKISTILSNRRGDALLSMLLASFLVAMVFKMFLSMAQDMEQNFAHKTVAEQMSMVAHAVRGYMEANNGTLVRDPAVLTTPATSLTLNLSDAATRTLLLPYFPAGMTVASMPQHNIWGDGYRVVFVRSEDPGGNPVLDTVTGYLYTVPHGAFSKKNRTAGTVKGDKFLRLEQKQIVARGGATFGWTETAGTLQGLTWRVAGLPGLLPGYLGCIIGFGDKAESLTALQRFDSGDPELNRMHTSIDMNRFDLDNVGSLRLEPSDANMSVWETDCANNQKTRADGTVETGVNNVGRVFFASRGNAMNNTIANTSLAICREMGGRRSLAFIGDSAVEDSVRYIMTVSDGEKVPKPICPGQGLAYDGGSMDLFSPTGQQPRIFVLPQVISSGSTSYPLGAVKVWAEDDGSSWTVRINALSKQGSKDTWKGLAPTGTFGSSSVYSNSDVNAGHLRVVVMGICSSKNTPF